MTTEIPSTTLPSQDERITAALAHGAIIIPYVGILGPIMVWVTQKERSAYVALQALQAIALQALLIVLWFLGMGCYMCSIIGMIPATIVMAQTTPEDFLGLGFIFPFAVFGMVMLIQFFFVIYGVVGVVQCLRGRDFRYVLVGGWVERYSKS
jgi:uncharacterized Tic20 family protein